MFRTPRIVKAYPSSAWSPSDISATYDDPPLLGWWKADAGCFDATSGGNACTNGSLVKRWEDQSGNGYHLTTTTGAPSSNQPRWIRPADNTELPAIVWFAGAAAGTVGGLQWPKTGLGWLGRLDCPIIDGKDTIFVAMAVRHHFDEAGNNAFTPVAIMHGAPNNGSDYDKLPWFRGEHSDRTAETVGGVRNMAQRRWYCWTKFTPADDAVPSPYAYTMSPNSFAGADSDNASGTGRKGRSRRWEVSSFAMSRKVPSTLATSRWAWQPTVMGRSITISDWGATGPTGTATFPSTTSNAILVNGYHTWSDYGSPTCSAGTIGEVIILGGNPTPWLRWKIDGYLAHRWGCANGLMHDFIPNSSPPVTSNYHPYRIATPPKFAHWRPSMLSSLRSWCDETAIASLDALQESATWTDNSHDLRNPTQGNWLQDFHVSQNTRNGRKTIAIRLTTGSTASTITNLQMTTGTPGNSLLTGRTLRGVNAVVLVFVVNPQTTADRIIAEWRTVSTTADHLALRTIGAKFAASRWLNLTTGDTTGTSSFTTSDWRMVMGVWDYAGGKRQVWVNGTMEAETTGLATGVSPSTGELRVAVDFNNTASSFTGHMAEFIALDAVPSTSDRQKLEGYLANKWAIPLPVGHPYEETVP